MLERLSKRLSSVAAPDPSSQPKDVSHKCGIRDIPWAVELYTVQLVTIRSSLQVTVEPLQPVRCDKAWGKGGGGARGQQ